MQRSNVSHLPKTGRRFALLSPLGLALAMGALAGCGDNISSPNGAAQAKQHEPVAVVNSNHPGAALYGERCSQCHNGNGSGNSALKAPALTTLAPWYVIRQLQHFRDGIRGTHKDDTHGQTMASASAALSDTDIALLASYVGEMPAKPIAATLYGSIEQGKDYHMNLCSACHGTNGLGNEALSAPALAGLNDWYLVAQYEHFRARRRGTHPADIWGAQMHRLAPAVAKDVVIAIASYHATLPVQ